MPKDCSRLRLLPEAPLGEGRGRLVKGSSFVFLSAETLHYHDDQVRGVLATVEEIITLDRGLGVVVEGGVVKHFPRPVDLVEHIVLNIVSLLFRPFNLPSQFK